MIDNNSCEDATVIQVDSVNKHGILLDVVQALTDMNRITEADVSVQRQTAAKASVGAGSELPVLFGEHVNTLN